MATKVIQTFFQLRRGLSTEWTSVNPVLKDGEPGFEIDTGKLKIGRNSTPWNNLPYISGSATIETDDESIELVDGKASLYGFSAAGAGFLASKGADGKLNWTNKVDINMLEIPDGTQLVIEDYN